MKNKIKFFILSFFLLSGVFLCFNSVLAKNYFYESINVDIKINEDSTFNVSEKQTYRLNGSFGYFYRDISLRRIDHISNINIFDGNGNKIPENEYNISYNNGYKRIKWNFSRKNFKNKLKSWTIKYKVHGALGFYKNHDELYWNAVFSNRQVKVEKARIKVYLDKSLDKKDITKEFFVGYSDSKKTNPNHGFLNSSSVYFEAEDIMPDEAATIVVTWPKGFTNKPFLYRNQIINLGVLIFVISLILFVFLKSFLKWKKTGKDPEINKSIIAEYEPPENLKPAEVGILINQKFDIKYITATIIDLAVRGYIKVKEENENKWWNKKEYYFEKQEKAKNLNESNLKPFEELVIQGLFSSKNKLNFTKNILTSLFSNKKDTNLKEEKDIVSTSDLKNNFYRNINKIKKSAHKELSKTDYITGNILEIRFKNQLPYLILIIGGIFFSVIAGIILSKILGTGNFLIILLTAGFIISGLIGLFFGYYMPALTNKGTEQKRKWLGFKEYLHTAERFRLGAETTETFSKYLPYAVVFGVEKEWAKRFENLQYKQPNWYVPAAAYKGNGFHSFADLSSGISSFTSSISSAVSPPSSGAGGGGSAGGGAGGGGGGAG